MEVAALSLPRARQDQNSCAISWRPSLVLLAFERVGSGRAGAIGRFGRIIQNRGSRRDHPSEPHRLIGYTAKGQSSCPFYFMPEGRELRK